MAQMVNKGDFFATLTEEQRNAGYIKFNIPDEEHPRGLSGEGVWGWVSPEDHEKWNNDDFTGKIKAILLNDPLNYYGRLVWGTEVTLWCHGSSRPTLDPDWVSEFLSNEEGRAEDET